MEPREVSDSRTVEHEDPISTVRTSVAVADDANIIASKPDAKEKRIRDLT